MPALVPFLRELVADANAALEEIGATRARVRQLLVRLQTALDEAEDGERAVHIRLPAAQAEPEAEAAVSRADPALPRGAVYVVRKPRAEHPAGQAGIYLHYQAFARQLARDPTAAQYYSRFTWAPATEGKKATGPDEALAYWYETHSAPPRYYE